MNRTWRFLLLALATTVVSLPSYGPARGDEAIRAIPPTAQAPLKEGSARPGELIVQFRQGADESMAERALREVRAVSARRGQRGGAYLVTFADDASVPGALEKLTRMAEVDYAERNGLLRKHQARTFQPNDQFFRFQWNFKQIGAERTWGIQQGKRTVGVAIVDTGVAYENYVDPVDGRRYAKAPDWGDTPFLPGFDFVNQDSHPNDDEGHGTHVAATIAEATNNSIGVAGLAFGVSLMPIKVLDREGVGSFFDVAAGIDFATNFSQGDTKVRVINLSLGGGGQSQTVTRAIDGAVAAGIVVVASAGNDGRATIDFPAALPNVIAVGAVDAQKAKAIYSNFGSQLSVVAPGGDCRRDTDGDGFVDCIFQQTLDPDALELDRFDTFCYCGLQGTSQAAPHVSAIAALLVSQGFNDPAAVKAAIEQTAERLGGAPERGRNDTFGSGLVRPAAALAGLGFNQGPQ
jgi:serine protease